MKHIGLINIPVIIFLVIIGCKSPETARLSGRNVRPLVDTVGFAHYSWQMDSLMARLDRTGWKKESGVPWRFVICPHDDYTYVGKLYPELLQNVKAKNLILIGVAHKAAKIGIADSLVFGSYRFWKAPWKNVPVSTASNELFSLLKGRYAIMSDTLQRVEHSVEAMIPFLQYFDRDISIIPILVPAMSPDRLQECGKALAEAIRKVATKHRWEWGSDFAIVATTDAVHYGNQDWGGTDYAFFGCDSTGNIKARQHEAEIIQNCLVGKVMPENFRLFSTYTLKSENYKDYKWTWCGRYSVPLALYTSYYLNSSRPITGELVGYSTSITSGHIPVDDIRMGRTAIATDCHWVGYAAIGYR
ncbi:MAG: AmmeMemoRadiSam system protein B [Bacteroidales bacterium]